MLLSQSYNSIHLNSFEPVFWQKLYLSFHAAAWPQSLVLRNSIEFFMVVFANGNYFHDVSAAIVQFGEQARFFSYRSSLVKFLTQVPLFHISQNAMRATIETHESSRTLPPIKVMVALGGEDLSIKVRNDGGTRWRASGN